MSVYSDYLRRRSQDAIRFGYSSEYSCTAENSKGRDLKSYEICGNTLQKNKNLLPFPYFENTKTVDGITFTCNNDGSVTANGTATALTKFYLTQSNQKYYVPRSRYWVSGCPSGGSSNTYYQVFEWYKDNVWIKSVHDTGSGVFVNTYTENYDACVYSIRIAAGTTVDNLTFKPMLMSLDDAENLIPYPFYRNTFTQNGVTFTDDREGRVVVNGTVTDTCYCGITSNYTGPKSEYFLFGCPPGGSATTYGLHTNLRSVSEDGTTTYVAGFNDYGSGVRLDLSQYEYTHCEFVISAKKDATISNAVFSPKLVDISYVSQVPSFDNIIPIKSVGTKSKNVVPYPFATSTSTVNGITVTDKGNGTLVFNGTASAFTAVMIAYPQSFNLDTGKYWFSGCPSGGGSANYYMYLAAENPESDNGSWQVIKDFTETGSGMVVDLTGIDYTGIYVSIGIKEGATVNNLEFKPFIMSIDNAENIIPMATWQNHSKLGINIVNNRDGSLTFNGTCTGSFYLSAPPTARFNFIIPRGKYYFDGVTGGSHSTFGQYFELFNFSDRLLTQLYTGPGTVDTSKFDYNLFNVEIWIGNGHVVTDLVWKPRLVSIDYEPPAMYKIPVIVRGSNEINFPYNNVTLLDGTYENSGITYTINNDGTIIANGTATTISQLFIQTTASLLTIDPSKYYYFTGCPKDGSAETYYMEILPYISRSAPPISSFRDIGQGVKTSIFSVPANYFLIKIVIQPGTAVENLVFKPMLVKGESASTSFEPYHEPITKNIWVKEPLRKTRSTVYDMIDFNKSRVDRNIGNTIINGSEDWKILTGDNVTKDNVTIDISNLQFSQVSNSLIDTGRYVGGMYSSGTYHGYTGWSAASPMIMYRKDNITPDEMKQSLQAHPSEVISQLKSSTIESIEIPKLPSFRGTTIYETDTEVAPSNMKIKYVRK